jgi:hypothetical protein
LYAPTTTNDPDTATDAPNLSFAAPACGALAMIWVLALQVHVVETQVQL